MRRIRFYIETGYVRGGNLSQIVEFDDDASEEEIESAWIDWVANYSGWEDVSDDNDE